MCLFHTPKTNILHKIEAQKAARICSQLRKTNWNLDVYKIRDDLFFRHTLYSTNSFILCICFWFEQKTQKMLFNHYYKECSRVRHNTITSSSHTLSIKLLVAILFGAFHTTKKVIIFGRRESKRREIGSKRFFWTTFELVLRTNNMAGTFASL